MAKLGTFSPDLVPVSWFDETARAAGFFSQELIEAAAASATITPTAAAVDASDLTTYTFSSQSFGDAASDRVILVTAAWRLSSGDPVISSATIGGVSATIVRQDHVARGGTAVLAAEVPTGTTGDVVINFDIANSRCGIKVYRATGISLSSPNTNGSTDPNTSLPDTTAAVDVTTFSGGVAVGVAVTTVLGTDTIAISWTGTDGLTAETQQVVESSGGVFSVEMRSGYASDTSAASRDINAFFDYTGITGLSGYSATVAAFAAVATAVEGSAQLGATAAITATGQKVGLGAAQFAATSALTASGTKVAQGSAQLNATAAITATGEAVGATPEPEVRPDAGGGGSKRYWRGIAGRVAKDDVNAILAKLRSAKRKKSVKVLVAAIKQAPPALVEAVAPSIAPVLELPALSVNTGENRQQIENAYAAVMSALALEREAELATDDEEVEELLLMYGAQRRRIVAMALEVLAS